MTKYELIIDHDLCWGCRACEVACKQEHHAPDGIRFIAVGEDGPKIIEDKLD
ncbi:MAG: 4Fe-4S binding protein, partial [Deltaproteobacteria bacterium]|nr:4Fe-4S binding protein [Deltaproteobacteria bacterium]